MNKRNCRRKLKSALNELCPKMTRWRSQLIERYIDFALEKGTIWQNVVIVRRSSSFWHLLLRCSSHEEIQSIISNEISLRTVRRSNKLQRFLASEKISLFQIRQSVYQQTAKKRLLGRAAPGLKPILLHYRASYKNVKDKTKLGYEIAATSFLTTKCFSLDANQTRFQRWFIRQYQSADLLELLSSIASKDSLEKYYD